MLSNDILRSLRYTLKANNNDMVRILALSPWNPPLLVLTPDDQRGRRGVCSLP